MHQPLVSIIISAYNAEKYISETLDSVLNQTWKQLEVIVVNDGSTDHTESILKAYADQIVYVYQENKGQDAALNNGYRHSTGEWIKFMDADDLINPEMIALQVKKMEGKNNSIAYGEWSRFYRDDPTTADFTPLAYWKDSLPIDFLTARPEGVMLQCGIMLIHRTLIEKAGIWDERLVLFNDTEYYTRLLLHSDGIIFTEGAKLYYRSGIASSVSAQRSQKHFESTFLATSLIEELLLKAEDSFRVRQLIANTYFNQYFEMYPRFKDLQKKHSDKIKILAVPVRKVQGGKIFMLINALLGWKAAKRIQFVFYRFGYQPGGNSR